MKMKKTVIAFCLALSLAACVTYRPQYDDDYKKSVLSVIDETSETIRFNDHAIWHPNRSTIPIRADSSSQIEGNMVITDKNLYFLEWDSNETIYNTVKKLSISEIKSVKIVKYGLNRQFVIQSKNGEFDLFAFTSYIAIDVDKNVEASKYLNSLINQDTASK